MTTEEKARAYDEALERAKNYCKGHHTDVNPQAAMGYVFPNLKESEDERIRKQLLNWFKGCHWDSIDNETLKRDDIIAWLEKQDEKKHSDYPYIPGWRENRPDNKPKIKHSIFMLTTHGVAEGEWLGEEWCQYRWSCKVKDEDVLYWLHPSDLETLEKENVKQDFSSIEKQGEQEPVWSEDDEKMREKLLFLMEEENSIDSWGGCYEWLQSLNKN